MKKVYLLVLSLSLIAFFAGCSKNVTAKFTEDLMWDEAAGHYQNEKNAELVLWHSNEEFADNIVALWEELYPDVPLSYELTSTTENAEKLKLDGPAGLGADVLYMPHNSVVDIREAGGLFMLAERDKNEIMANMLESSYKVAMYEEDLYAVPASVENIALVYNKQILKALPTLPSVIKTSSANLLQQLENDEIYFEELLKGIADWGNSYAGAGVEVPYMAERFTDAEDRHSIMAWQLYDAYHNYPLLTRDGYRVFGPDNNDPGKFNLTSEEVLNSIKSVTGSWYGDKDNSALFPGLANIEDLGWDQGPSKMQKGHIAITVTGPWVMSDIKKNWETWIEEGKYGITEESALSDIFGAKTLPTFNNGQHPVTFSGVQVTGMNIYTEYPNAAMNLMNFLADIPVMKEIYSTLGNIPAVKESSLIPGLNKDSISQGFLSQAAFSHPMPVIQEGNYMWDPLRDVWTNIFNEKMSIKDAQIKSQTDYERILVDSGK